MHAPQFGMKMVLIAVIRVCNANRRAIFADLNFDRRNRDIRVEKRRAEAENTNRLNERFGGARPIIRLRATLQHCLIADQWTDRYTERLWISCS
jgi:hypothetical protein